MRNRTLVNRQTTKRAACCGALRWGRLRPLLWTMPIGLLLDHRRGTDSVPTQPLTSLPLWTADRRERRCSRCHRWIQPTGPLLACSLAGPLALKTPPALAGKPDRLMSRPPRWDDASLAPTTHLLFAIAGDPVQARFAAGRPCLAVAVPPARKLRDRSTESTC